MQDPYSGRFTWNDRDFSKWELAESRWQRFYQHWLNPENHGALQHTSFPHSLTICPKDITPILSVCAVNEILVLDSYPTMFERLRKRYYDQPRTGAVITGQPGIGKSVFICYLLVKLLALPVTERAPILFYYNMTVLLFYDGKVYQPKSSPFLFQRLPEPRSINPIWACIDMGPRLEEPSGVEDAPVFAVQAASPNPVQFQGWRKLSSAANWGLPPWTTEQLIAGWELQETFKTLNVQILAWVEGRHDHGLPKEHARVLELAKSYCAKPSGEIFEQNGTFQPPDEDAPLKDDSSLPPKCFEILDRVREAKKDDVLVTLGVARQILLEFATATFGFSARDIYTFFDKPDTLFDAHKSVLVHDLDDDAEALWNETYDFVRDFRGQRKGLHLSHQTIAIEAQSFMDDEIDDFHLEFKSEVISSRMIEKLRLVKETTIASFFNMCRGLPDSETLASLVYEGYVHRKICEGGPVLSLQSMPFPPNHFRSFPSFLRQRVNYVAVDQLPELILTRYYIPSSPNNSLFDSFFFSEEEEIIILWILKASMAVVHHDSVRGYSYIMAVWDQVREQFNRPVQIRYLLVGHEYFPEPVPQWTLPLIPTELPKETFSAEMYYLGLPLPDHNLEAAEDRIGRTKKYGDGDARKSRIVALENQLSELIVKLKAVKRELKALRGSGPKQPKQPRTPRKPQTVVPTTEASTSAVAPTTKASTSAAAGHPPYQLRSRGVKKVPKRNISEVEDGKVETISGKHSRIRK
ncbi:hypothetical protein BT96DRAFT_1013074 [Gymnopus androsaceus JB14]|uniref:Uncharacterized protein n=1 Tax=Gymnopus androsaceus JB14 TaxID=1447944 RepID=A0A6A4IK73_9AGAR|nr:hypothetical protein BT96DRAFT_1013074 [Gymnopus androsaceus JB14]